MADDVPVCDVLLEAMEYLVKLGSNLRTRSESLKDKRIRRDKLKNAHAVQKAANKVLTICELSKKSLENVESGVKRVLRLVDKSQAAAGVGGNADRSSLSDESKTSDRQQSSEKKDYQYFKYRSNKLKIRKKVPVKHYMSVKVLARQLPKSMRDKYPVYYDCKLYRMRKRKILKEQERREILESMKMFKTDSATDIVKEDEKCMKKSKEQKESEAEDGARKLSSQDSGVILGDKRNLSEESNSEAQKHKQDSSVEKKEKSDSESENRNKETQKSSGKAENDVAIKERQKECKKKLLEDSDSEPGEQGSKEKSSEKSPDDKGENKDASDSSSECKKSLLRDSDSESELQGRDESVKRNENSTEKKRSDDKRRENVKRHPSKDDSSLERSKSDYEKLNKAACVRKDRKKSAVIESDSDDETKKNNEYNSEKSDKKTFHEDDNNSETEKEKQKNKNEKISFSKRKKRILSTDSKTSQEESDKEDKETKNLSEEKPKDSESDKEEQHNKTEKKNQSKRRKSCSSRTAKSSEDSDSQDSTKVRNNTEKDLHKKDLIDLASDNEKSEPEKEDKTEQEDQNKEETKPLIKCVSLTKLLKPEILPKVIPTSDKHSVISESSKKSIKAKKTVRYQDEEEFWSQKRAEVKAFKPKEFSIRITRLSLDNVILFLKIHNIKRIIRGGKIIHEIKNENEIPQKKNKDKSFEEWSDMSKVKTALLIESDSDDDVNIENKKKTVPGEAECKVNESTNNKEIESEKSNELQPNELENESNDLQSTNNVEDISKTSNKDINDSTQLVTENNLAQEGQNDNTSKSPENVIPLQGEDTEAVKSALLNDSSNSTPTPTSPKHEKKKLSESTKKSKRKHIMESMKAKKMLLTYSSSSETEDEDLKKAFKQIKEALLKEGSSEDEFSKISKPLEEKKSSDSESDANKKRSREQLSSDSEEQLLRKVKKKRKIRKTSRRSNTKSRTPSPTKKDAENGNPGHEGGDNLSMDSTIDQVDGTVDEQSNSSNSKMGRSNEKAGSSQSSDALDDKDIDGLTNLNSLNKTRRRRDSDASGAASGSSKRKSRMPKPTPLIQGEEGLLEAPMTDDESGEESEGGVEEDLPPVTLSGINGGGIAELAKDDLLGESDSSSSNEKEQSEDNAKKEESSSEDQIKLKRRKIAISSDSEAGSSRRKRNDDVDVKLSDFEDSETEGSEPVKKSKRKKKVDSDDGSAGSSSESGKKKRKRIKQIDDSDASGSDSDNEGRNKHGRKNIRKVMGKNQLEEATKKAARQEKERIARIAERQKLYNNLEFDESGKPDEVVLDKVVLDFDPETKEPLIEVDRGLVKKLKPHQANGIKFMWDACFESVKRIKKDKGSGCILAHCMGLGKTLQVVSLTHTLLTHAALTRVRRVLVVCPLSTVLNWVNEFRMWLEHAEADCEVDVYELSRYKQNSERAYQLSQWYTHGGVCVLGYEMFRNLSADNPKKYKKKMLKTFQEALVDPGPDMVVCDEGHLLKNEKTSLSQSMNRVRTLRRVVLTGTPLQNNLKEYYCMVQFVKPNLLGKYNEYLNRFVNPITNGQYTDSTEHDIRVMKRRSHVLHKMLDGAVQRRDYGVLAPFLPPKHEYVLFITLSAVQVKLYQHYLDNYSRRPLPGKSSGFLFPDFQSLQRIWTHPLVLKYNSERYELMQQKKRDKEEEDSEGSLADFIDDDSSPEETSTEESSDDLSDLSDDSHKKSKKKKDKKSKTKETAASRRRGTRANPVEMEDEEVKDLDQIEGKNDNPTEWWIPLVTEDELEDVHHSHKLLLLLEILRQCEAIGDKLLVFSQSLYSLDLIEHFLGKIDEATQDGRVDEKLGGHVGSWAPGVDYFRLDGSTSCENRSIWCKNFNREDNPRARLFLISTRAGGLGINLVAANRVVIFDVSWNPSHDVQSIFRVYRFGQKKPCYIYRFLAMGTMEEKIYERQVTKQAISKRVIDEQQIDRHYAENDLAELYKFEPTPPSPRPVPLVPKDRLFAEMLKQHEACIYKFHEHDSLLENKEEETLTEEERKAAWEDFENEKNRPPPAPFAAVWPQHNGMAGLLAQQQQQLAFAALAGMLRKDMPGLSEDQIRAMLPLIYTSNPGLMQKLNDIYKYPQPSMMNPAAMMNSVMNPAAAGAGAGGGGTSGLQYEPPWAREQQQQQQMRLQQIMQHQNMGAKYYAGGLGSRDPVAMALQQQRAREIMLERGGAAAPAGAGAVAGRPRGRPPLQPRAPPPGDVVTLDSD